MEINNIYPALYLGYRAVQLFKKEYKGPIREFSNIDDVKEFVAYYSTIEKLPYVLVVEDLSRLSNSASSALLKFVEETSLEIVLLSMFDNVSPVMLSRMRRVVKEKDTIKSDFLSIKEGLSSTEDIPKDLHPYVRLKKVMEVSPLLAIYEAHPKYRKTLKILRIVK